MLHKPESASLDQFISIIYIVFIQIEQQHHTFKGLGLSLNLARKNTFTIPKMNTSSTSSVDKNATKHSPGKIVFTHNLKKYTKSKQVVWKTR